MQKLVKFFVLVFASASMTNIFSTINWNYFEDQSCYISRWSIESLCDHIYDPYCEKNRWSHPTCLESGITIDPCFVKLADVVFIRNIDKFFADIHPKIKFPYIIVSHGDYQQAFKHKYLTDYLPDEKIIAWFSVHTLTNINQKLHALPLGVDQRNLKLFHSWKSANEIFYKLRKKPKEKLIYINFNVNCRKRLRLKSALKQQNYSDFFFSTPNKSHTQYFSEMAECKFTLCPQGFGPDSYRIWEALLVGSIPVIEKCSKALMQVYSDLPILVVKNLKSLNKEFLEQEYEKMVSNNNYNFKKLYVSYWQKKIDRVKSKFLENNKQFK